MTRRFSERQAYLLLAALAIALFADVIVAGAGFHFRDIPRLYVPGDRVIHDVIAGGEFPLWNPRWSNGQPLAANPGFSVFYPILLLLFLFSFARGFAMQIVVSYVIAATGMFALLRSRDVSVFGAFFGAVIYGFGGMLASYSDLLPFLYAASLLPWVGFFFTRYVDNPNRRDFAASALVLGCLLLTGEQSVILQIGALLSLYAILKRRPIALTIIAAAVLVAAVQLFPAIDFQRDTPRAIGLPYATATFWSVPKARFLELFFPDLFGRWASDAPQYWGSRFLRRFPSPFTSNIYASLAAAIFFAAGIARRIRGWSFAASVALISYLLALGENGPLFPLLYRAGFHSLRYPEKFLTSTIFIFSVFAAIVADRAVADDTSRKTSARIAAVVAAITIASLILISTPLGANLFGAIFQRGGAALAAARSGWMVMTIVAIALTAILAIPMQTSLRALLLAGLVVVDLATRFQGLTPRISADFYTPPPAARQLASTNFRVRLYNDKDWMRFFKRSKQPPSPRPAGPWIARNSLLPMSASTWGLSSAIDPDIVEVFLLPSRQFTELFLAFRLMNRPERTALLLRMAGVTHVASERVIDLNSVDPRSAEPIALTAINAPPLYFAGEIVQARNAFAMRDVLLSARPLTNPAFIEQNAFAPAPGRVLGFAQTANTITADVESEGRAFLVFTTTAHRYWRATIDDRETPIEPTNIAFQGVVVPPGRHRIALRYSNPVVIVCGIISIIAIAALAAMIAWPLRSRESPPPSPH